MMAYVWAGMSTLLYVTLFIVSAIVGIVLLLVGMVVLGVDPESPQFLYGILGFESLILLIIPIGYMVQVSAYRAIWWHLSGKEVLSWSSSFRAALERPGHTLGLAVLTAPMMLLGVLMCYLPAILVMLWMHLAVCVMIVDEVGPFSAYKKSLDLFRNHPKYHSKMVGMGTLLEVAIMQIPLVGWVVGYPIGGMMHLVAYRESQRETFGD
jgi:hypothetical protein